MTASSSRAEKIGKNYRNVLGEVAEAAAAAGRNAAEIRTIGVTKYFGIAEAKALVDAGCLDLGESRPQEIWEKSLELPQSVRWHLIGHLQRNKVRRTLPLIHLLHSLDSDRLAGELQRESLAQGIRASVLLEIHIAGDATKTGMRAEDAEKWLAMYASDDNLRQQLQVLGLMGMSSLGAEAPQIHREFEFLRNRMHAWNDLFGMQMNELSMGMSQDYAIAIAQGATMVRIGSRLFEGLPDAET
jgi:pyridoxal phosphate enzyme (YggS family)